MWFIKIPLKKRKIRECIEEISSLLYLKVLQGYEVIVIHSFSMLRIRCDATLS